VTCRIYVVLKKLYPDAVKQHNYSKTLTSVAFAGTVVGMLTFGYISDKIGRKFGMVRPILVNSTLMRGGIFSC
jgi:MFS family permease